MAVEAGAEFSIIVREIHECIFDNHRLKKKARQRLASVRRWGPKQYRQFARIPATTQDDFRP
jgi:hypothetical protein